MRAFWQKTARSSKRGNATLLASRNAANTPANRHFAGLVLLVAFRFRTHPGVGWRVLAENLKTYCRNVETLPATDSKGKKGAKKMKERHILPQPTSMSRACAGRH